MKLYEDRSETGGGCVGTDIKSAGMGEISHAGL